MTRAIYHPVQALLSSMRMARLLEHPAIVQGHAGLSFSLRPVWLLLEGIWLFLEGKGYKGCSRRHLQLCMSTHCPWLALCDAPFTMV